MENNKHSLEIKRLTEEIKNVNVVIFQFKEKKNEHVFTLYNDYIQKTGTKYDILVRCRLDTLYNKSLLPLFKELLETPKCQVIALSDQFMCGRPEPMSELFRVFITDYFQMPFTTRPDSWDYFILSANDYYDSTKTPAFGWYFAPEKQFSECLFRWCDKNNLQYREALKGYPCSDYVRIYKRHLFA